MTTTVHRTYCPRCGGRLLAAWDSEVEAECVICGFASYRATFAGLALAALMAEADGDPTKLRRRQPSHGKLRL